MNKIIYFFVGFLFCFSSLFSEDFGFLPFSKITITSNSAVCEKDKKEGKDFLITYKDDVLVKLSEQSNIKAGSLAITLKGLSFEDTVNKELKIKKPSKKVVINSQNSKSKSEVKSSSSMDMFKKIELIDNVKIQHGNRFLTANKIEVFANEKICELSGNIKIAQKKEVPADIPITAECERAVLNMNTKEITLFGSSEKPVTTVITIDGLPGLTKKIKTPEEKKAEKEALKKMKREAKLQKKLKNL